MVAFVARRTKPCPEGYEYHYVIVEEKFKNVTSYTFPEDQSGRKWYLDTIFVTPYDNAGVPTDCFQWLICSNDKYNSRNKLGYGDEYSYYGSYNVDIYYK